MVVVCVRVGGKEAPSWSACFLHPFALLVGKHGARVWVGPASGKISRAEWREWARQKREMMQRFNSEKEALVADNKRLRASMDPLVRLT